MGELGKNNRRAVVNTKIEERLDLQSRIKRYFTNLVVVFHALQLFGIDRAGYVALKAAFHLSFVNTLRHGAFCCL